ncbi:NusG domain II-containing protein [bacterium]|nr:NusG domain II-containing protein [bacterium]
MGRETFRLPPLFTLIDLLLVLIVVVFSAGFYHHGSQGAGKGPLTAVVQFEDRELARLSLERDTTVTVNGVLGTIKVVVADGAVKFEDSHCPARVCEKTGWIRRAGAAIVCAPNHVLCRLERSDGALEPADGKGKPGLDALVR